MTIKTSVLLGATMWSAVQIWDAQSAGNFDGSWSVLVRTDAGDCPRGYELPVVVENGKARSAGPEALPFAGSVSTSGAVRVSVSLGARSATIAGRLTEKSGAGTWYTGSNDCSGSWSATKRDQ